MVNEYYLLENIEKLHTTPMRMERIRRNLGLGDDVKDVVDWCRKRIMLIETNIKLTLDTTLLSCNFRFSQCFRDFFSEQTGIKNFKFNTNMVAILLEKIFSFPAKLDFNEDK